MELNLTMLGQLASTHFRRQRMPPIGSRELDVLEVLGKQAPRPFGA